LVIILKSYLANPLVPDPSLVRPSKFFLNIKPKNQQQMKKIFLLLAGCSLLLVSCEKKGEAGMSDRAKKNLEACRTVAKAFESGDPKEVDNVVAEDFVDHTPMGDMNRDSLKHYIVMMHEKDPSAKMETLQEFANDDYAVVWYRFSGNSDGSMGMPAGPYDMKAMEVVKFNKDSKAVEHWEYMDVVEMMKMKPKDGDAPPPGNADTTRPM
jgi:predicted SnoaL-like aldol condensation-catalyzing enzyme